MSRRTNNLKRMKEAKKQRRNLWESEKESAKEVNSGGGIIHMDTTTGEIREGGIEIWTELQANLKKEREMFKASSNPFYLVGRVKLNESAFTKDEILQMVEATIFCACNNSPDPWYPNQYLFSLAQTGDKGDLAYFLCNFELGLRLSGNRAAKHKGQGDWLKESRNMAARLDDCNSLDGLTEEDCQSIGHHIATHPRLADLVAYYERGSGIKLAQ